MLYLLRVSLRSFVPTYLPQEVTVGLLKAAMLTSSGTQGFLIDGFPRELQQGRMFTEQVPTVE